MGNLITGINSWLHEPFTTPLDTVQIFLLVGLLMIALIFWGRILAAMREG